MAQINSIVPTLQKYAGKLQQNRYLQSISDGLMSTLPFLIIGALSTLLTSISWEPYQAFIAPVKSLLGIPGAVTTGMIALYAAFFIAYKLAETFDHDPLLPGAVSLVTFLLLTPISVFDEVRALPLQWLGAQGLFVAIIIGLLSSRLYVWVLDRNWTIKMPEGVPPTVAKTFIGLIPAIIVVMIFIAVAGLFQLTSFNTVHEFIYSYLQIPLQGLGGSLGALIIALIIMQGLWFFGIHGAIVTLAIVKPIWMSLDLQNLEAFQAGEPLPNIIGLAFWSLYANFAPMIALTLLLAFRAKSKQLRTIGKLGLPGSFFGIHEPLIFGIPVVLNPILAVPFILGPVLCVIVAYIFTTLGIVPAPIGIYPPFGTPIFAMGLLEGSLRIALLQVLLVPICLVMYYPFFKALDKQYVEKSKAEEEASQFNDNTTLNEVSAGK
ncbi:PTS transporter subunit EIIC [Domibacillus sp. A3M-37]|uniref:PTS sugar transporter subunit IIC n=1 Tax=Domibacillus sp. A3M-37 TaxID=2962037 RepID=UPI0020B7B140|nr:PTS transporter subunit EIIC [Domibacillus sp. A3M-37]MCP3763715.1 PTS transporter subunit EIIC [Domibacillus sp. A3M-37]